MLTVTQTLGPRALNRALLARQHLLARTRMPALRMVEHLVGLQGQIPLAPYVGLWTRLADFDPEELAGALTDRSAVRIAAMRSTVFLLSARDALTLRPLTQPVSERGPYGKGVWQKALAGLERADVAARGRELLEERPLTNTELGAALAERFPGYDPATLALTVRNILPLVQVPPRGLWGRAGQARSTTLEHWTGAPLDPRPDIDAVVLRYLAAFGPASAADAQEWCGLTRLGPVLERLRPGLAVFRDAVSGRELFDLPEAPRPDPETPAPVRFLPDYDNLLLGHADRGRVMDERARALISEREAGMRGFLVDGMLAGTWRLERPGGPLLRVIPFAPLAADAREELLAEAERLAAFHGVAKVRVG